MHKETSHEKFNGKENKKITTNTDAPRDKAGKYSSEKSQGTTDTTEKV